MTSISSRPKIARLAMWCVRRRRLVLMGALAALIGLSALANTLGGEFRQSFAMPGSETQAAAERLADAGFDVGGQSGLAVLHAEDVRHLDTQAAFEAFLAAIDARDDVTVSVRPPGQTYAISSDNTVAFAQLDFGDVPRSDAEAAAEAVRSARDQLRLPSSATIELGGELFFEEGDFASAGVGLLAAAAILLVAFGSLLAMGLPIITALVGIGCAFAVVQLAAHLFDIPPFTPGVIAMIGLGAGVDYALLIVTRFREELAAGSSAEQAVSTAMATAGRSTLFAGTTVVTSLTGLLVVGLDDVRALALAAAAGVLFVMLCSVTVLPALLGFAGVNIDRFGLPHRRKLAASSKGENRWYRWSQTIQRRPLLATLAVVMVLLGTAFPVTSLRLGLADASARPETDTSRRAHDLIAAGFGPGFNGPLFLAVDLEEPNQTTLAGIAEAVSTQDGVHSASVAATSGHSIGLITVIPTTGPQDAATTELVHRLRGDILPRALTGEQASVLVGGATAAAVDFAAHNERALPWFVAIVLTASFVLLLVVFRSVLVPLKAVLANLLTVGAAYGTVVAVFQWGWLSGPLGLGEPGPIEAWVPMMLFAIVFGLSIDYEVFLMSRIRERYTATGDNSRAIAEGLARTGRLITAAAAIMICVFGAFGFADDRPLQMLGVGLAVALALDATLVRLILVPATMQLGGAWNWWLPRPLQRLLPSAADSPKPGTSAVPTPRHTPMP